MRKISRISTILLGLALIGGAGVQGAYAHGYVEDPESRGYKGSLEKEAVGWNQAFERYGNVIGNPQSLEFQKGFPESGPPDGHIASAGGLLNTQIGDTVLDIQTSTYWDKVKMMGGSNTFTWKYTAPHATSKWEYFITKVGWDPDAPLERSSFEKIAEIQHDGSVATNNPSHEVVLPQDRSGYYIVLAVWTVADTDNAFYNVIDVDLDNSGLCQIENM